MKLDKTGLLSCKQCGGAGIRQPLSSMLDGYKIKCDVCGKYVLERTAEDAEREWNRKNT